MVGGGEVVRELAEDPAAGLGFREALHAYSYRAPASAAAVRVRELYVVAPGTEAWRALARVTMGM